MITLQARSKKTEYAVGIDLGGTYIKSAIVSSHGKIVKQFKTESYSHISPKRVVGQIEKCITHLKRGFRFDLLGIGIGAPGIVTDGVVKYPPNFKAWKEVKLKDN